MQNIRSKLFYVYINIHINVTHVHLRNALSTALEGSSIVENCANYATVNARGICVSLVFICLFDVHVPVLHSINELDGRWNEMIETEKQRMSKFSIPIDRVSTN